jgi:hypothetical protein
MDSNCRSPVAKEVNPFREWEPSWSDKVRLEAVAYLPGTDSSNPSPSSGESANFRTSLPLSSPSLLLYVMEVGSRRVGDWALEVGDLDQNCG